MSKKMYARLKSHTQEIESLKTRVSITAPTTATASTTITSPCTPEVNLCDNGVRTMVM